MAEPLSDARLAELLDGCVDDQDAVVVLLAEVQRLRAEADLVAVMRGYVANLRRGTYTLAACLVAGAVIWHTTSGLVAGPWRYLVALPAGYAVGLVGAACAGWITGKWKADNG